ncbi:MAG: penicillin-binding protein 1C [Oceanospirillaceae bacterium]|nr:penicillin-binding protein 1C [Oceanospirillaceae bacterium]
MGVKKGLGLVGFVLLVPLLILLCLDVYYPVKAKFSASTVVLAEDGEVLRAFSNAQQQWRYPIDNDQVPAHYLDLLLGYEDRWFYWHLGVNPAAILRAAWQNWRAGSIVSGGSTLTMQVARLMHPHSRTLQGKVQQLLRALQLEWHYSKAQILNFYLNLAPFGGTLIGVQAASISYFDKPLAQLSDAEAALLAVLPQAPSRWHPNRHPQAARKARDKVLQRMQALNIWPHERVQDAQREPIFSLTQNTPMNAPLLARRLKRQCPDCETIKTLINLEMQQQLEALVVDYISPMAQGLSVALIVMENSSGAVRSYLGSADFLNNQRFGHVDMIQAVRSPGSTLKPFLYAQAIDRGLIHSQSLLQDAPRDTQAYRPKNFSGGFNGPVSVTQALQRSLNIPAVQVLEQLDPAYFAAKLQSAGLKLYWPTTAGANISMILGGVGTKLEHLVAAYSSLARSGIAIKARFQPTDAVVERHMLSAGAAWITWKMLAIHPVKTARSQYIDSNWPLAWKTGTSYGYREAWALGVSKKWSIGVWVGRPDASGSVGISGRKTAAPLLFKAFKAIADKGVIARPASVGKATICWPLGSSELATENAGDNCQQRHMAWILEETIPPTLSRWPLKKTLWHNEAGQRVNPSCEGALLYSKQLALWPLTLEPWITPRWRRKARLGNIAQHCQIEEVEPLLISSVSDGSTYRYNPQGLELALLARGGVGDISWYLNGRFIGVQDAGKSSNISLVDPGKYQLSAVDTQGKSDLVQFIVLKN